MTLDDHGWTQFLAAVRREIPSWEVFATEARVRASRSSSGSGEREALRALRMAVASDSFPVGRPAATYVLRAIDALSSAPPSPDSGDRVRALKEALSVIETEVSMFLDEDDGQVARLHTVLNVIRALSLQGDASRPSTDAPDTKEPTT